MYWLFIEKNSLKMTKYSESRGINKIEDELYEEGMNETEVSDKMHYSNIFNPIITKYGSWAPIENEHSIS